MTPEECRTLFASQSVARLATVGQGRPHLVPIVFAIAEDRIVTAVDQKPKTTHRLRRILNIEDNPAVAVLADEYHEQWADLWWVRADGVGSVIESGPQHATAVDLLAAKYHQYRENPPTGAVIDITVERWSGWVASA